MDRWYIWFKQLLIFISRFLIRSIHLIASLLPDFEYDIFISYRHNDNLFDGWVTEFVTRLQEELAATIKERLSIYFDKNLRDGLSDTALVAPSLEHRLRAFILIPLISQTYCDTERFSWKHEFLPFHQQASHDRLGLYLRLPSGNVGCRILPLRIHNLDSSDVHLLETTLGGHLRTIDFVYEDLGVNRPLRAKDDELPRPTGGLLYRNQINKVANAIKELVAAVKQPAPFVSPAVFGAPSILPLPTPTTTFPVAVPAAAPSLPPPPSAGPVVFLAWTSKELAARREELALVCTKAGLQVVPSTDCPLDEEEFRVRTQEAAAAATCAVHLLGNEFGRRFEEEEDCSFPMFAYQEARRLAATRPAFRQFIWYCPDEALAVKPAQKTFVNNIRNELTERCTFTSALSAMQLVQDLRSTLSQASPPPLHLDKETDIFFVYNQLDSEEANEITDRLSEEIPLELLIIEPNSEDLYKEITVRTIPKSKLAVVYFKHSADWALPFVKQIWRLVGGAGSSTPILFVGEDEPVHNRLRTFKAPRVISCIQPHQGVSEEVRRIFQQVDARS
ncbi:hypothetical protein [Hymenobacter crusticola]|uniref:TIR domain-containing protein n=1 Tax=Hymenobacter crusticola TaxID=1770526 RepID=A0A243WHG8_9BACT|nr:hypothetical protein [Hymenobacter crusticola]OUJ74927.1 hypothetical protein BXP70_09275 [Hymenobacter crusticola]